MNSPPSSPDSPTASGAVTVDQSDQVPADLPDQHHAYDIHGLGRR